MLRDQESHRNNNAAVNKQAAELLDVKIAWALYKLLVLAPD